MVTVLPLAYLLNHHHHFLPVPPLPLSAPPLPLSAPPLPLSAPPLPLSAPPHLCPTKSHRPRIRDPNRHRKPYPGKLAVSVKLNGTQLSKSCLDSKHLHISYYPSTLLCTPPHSLIKTSFSTKEGWGVYSGTPSIRTPPPPETSTHH